MGTEHARTATIADATPVAKIPPAPEAEQRRFYRAPPRPMDEGLKVLYG